MTSSKLWGAALVVASLAYAAPVLAGDDSSHCCIDWNRLNLTPAQSQQIQALEAQWAHDYNDIKPVIQDDQQKLTKLLADHSSDPVEIMSLQQAIARKKEQLNGLATANYLKKRQVLNENQQVNLEQMIRDAVRKRQAAMHPSSNGEVVTDRIQNLMQRVRNIWPSER